MAYTPQAADVTKISGSVLAVSAAATATWGREHECTGSTAYALTIPATSTNGAMLGVKVAVGYTGTGVTVTPPAGVTIDGGASLVMTAGQEFKFHFDGTNIVIE